MAINYAQKFSPLVDEAFARRAYTAGIVNDDYDWTGVDTVKVYSVPTVAMGNYTPSGSNRFGTPSELQNEVQTLLLTQDRAFTFSIDKKSEDDTVGVMDAAKALARQVAQVVIPEIDKYRITKLCAGAPASHVVVATCTSSNAYSEFLKVSGALDEDGAPAGGRVVLVTPTFYNLIKLDESFVKRGDKATEIAQTGYVGEIDGIPVIKVPSGYFPGGVDFVITNPLAMPSPIKLTQYRILDDVAGLSGSLVEGRIRYDAFVLNNKAAAIGVHRAAATYTAVTPATGDNPAVNGWFERSGSEGAYVYTLTADTTVDSSKTYYAVS